MPLRVHCPAGHAMKIRDEHVGRRVKCPTCGVGFLTEQARAPDDKAPTAAPAGRGASRPVPPSPLPAQPTGKEEVVDYDPGEDTSPDAGKSTRNGKHHKRSRNRRGRSRLAFWFILSGAGVGLLTIGAVLWWFVLGPIVNRLSFPLSLPEMPASAAPAAHTFHRHVEQFKNQHGENRVVLVCIKGLPIEAKHATTLAREKFLAMGFSTQNVASGRMGQPQDLKFVWVVVAPVEDTDALAKQIDFGHVAGVYAGRINVVADLSKFPGVP